MKSAVDPITMACIAGSLESIVREMSTVMLKTSRSGIFKLAQDYSDTLLDSNCQFIVIGKNEGLNHVGSASAAAKYVAQYFKGEIYPGDIMYHNDSATGGAHLPDCALLKPVFWEDELVAWSCNKAHMTDIGGSGTLIAKDLISEGLRIPPIKIYERGAERRDVVDLMMANVRYPELQRGDLRAQIAASAIGEMRFLELINKYGKQSVEDSLTGLFEVREREMRAWIASLPDGEYEATANVENPDDKSLLEISVTINIRGDEMSVRLNSPPQVKARINSYWANTTAGILIALSKFAKFSRPLNEGLMKPITIDYGPKGTLLNAKLPAPCTMCTTTPQISVIDMITEAFSKVVPENRQAAGWQHVTTLGSSGIHPKTGNLYSFPHFPAFTGGAGAVSGIDGYSGIGSEIAHGAQSRGHLEQYELEYPIRILHHEMVTDSPGAGKWRGGASYAYEFEAVGHECDLTIAGEDHPMSLSLSGAKSKLVKPKVAQRHIKNKKTGDITKLTAPCHSHLSTDETLQFWAAGGGGIGDPYERPIAKVREDVLNEVISIDGAREDYGVVIDAVTLDVDYRTTETLRKKQRV